MSAATKRVMVKATSKYSIYLVFENFRAHFVKCPVYSVHNKGCSAKNKDIRQEETKDTAFSMLIQYQVTHMSILLRLLLPVVGLFVATEFFIHN